MADFDDFLRAHDRDPATVSFLAGDASPRQYYRLAGSPSEILMDSVRQLQTVEPFLRMSAWLAGHGYSAPQVLAADAEQGYLLLEDLGDDLFARLLEKDLSFEQIYYETAIDLLVDIAKKPVPPGLPPYDDAFMQREVDIFCDWYLPAMDVELTGAQMADWRAIWKTLFDAARLGDPVMTFRDYHAENLIWLPERTGLARAGLLDYQDAVEGPLVYDLISLLQDARRDVSPDIRDKMMARFADGLDLDLAALDAAAAAMAVQRNIKIVGIFLRLYKQDGKTRYLDFLPRMWGLLDANLAHSITQDLKAFLYHVLPPRHRAADWYPMAENKTS